MASRVIKQEDLAGLSEILAPLAGNWEVFLIALGVTGSERAKVKAQHAHSPNFPTLCLVDGLERWVESDCLPTYGRVMHALSSNFMMNKRLAAQVESYAIKSATSKVDHAIDWHCSIDDTAHPPKPAKPGVCMYDKAHAVEKSKALQKRFILCAKNLKNHLKKESSFSDFLDEFIMELSPSVKHEHEKFFDRKNSEINKSSTFDELFTCLCTYWDFLNYTLLENIIDVHGTEELQQEMESFVRDVQDFRKKTTLNVFWQLDRHRMPTKPPPGFRQFVTKHSITRESTLEDVEKIRFEITQEFHLSKFALLLIDVVDGSVLITWFVPSLIISRLQERLGSLIGLHIEDVFYDSLANLQDLFHVAAERGDAGSLSELLKSGVDINEQRAGETAVMLAAEYGHTGAAHLLIESGADLNVRDTLQQTPLMLAVSRGHTDIVRALAAGRVDVNALDSDGRTALMLAAKCGHTGTVQALAALGADIHTKDRYGRTALMLAAEDGHTDTVQALAALGADIHILDEFGWTALIFAAWDGHTDTVQALAALGADIHVHTKDEGGRTAVMLAAKCGHTDLVQALAALGADIHIKDEGGRTAVMWAAERGHTDLVQALAALGADIHIKDEGGWNAVMLAAKWGHTDTVQALAVLGADMHSIQFTRDWTSLMRAAQYGNILTVKRLLERGANLQLQDKNGCNALMLAALYGYTEVAKMLVDGGADMNALDKNGRTALMFAASSGHPATLKALIELGADVHIRDKDGTTALILAIHDTLYYKFETVEALVEAGADLNIQEKATGWSPLFFAAKLGGVDLIRFLLEKGADPTVKDNNDITAYHVAGVYGHHKEREELAKHMNAVDVLVAMHSMHIMHINVLGPSSEQKALKATELEVSTSGTDTAASQSTLVQSESTTQEPAVQSITIRDRVLQAARILSERFKSVLPGRSKKKEALIDTQGREEEAIVLPPPRQSQTRPGKRDKKALKAIKTPRSQEKHITK